jgi:AraC family transcriptional regulator of adaptative response / DNA-3-methyladenine glycosylase II
MIMSENSERTRVAHAYDVAVLLDAEICYRAMLAHDARFDVRFFVAVSSTRIYCRPVCRVKSPKRENCTFFPTAAAAEGAGYRPYLRCRPELAPGSASIDAGQRIACSAASLIEEGLLNDISVDDLAKSLGITARHVRRVFQTEFGVSPIGFAQTQRLLLAKRLLTDTVLPITDIAFAAGFQSLRRMNALFHQRYRLTPNQIRKTSRSNPQADALVFDLAYRPPYDWNALIAFLGARSIAGVEEVVQSSYRRIISIGYCRQTHTGWMEVTPDPRKSAMRVVASGSLAKVAPIFLARVKHLLDLSCSPAIIVDRLGPLAAGRPPDACPRRLDGFEIAVRAVLGQQVSVAAVRTLAGRLSAAFGSRVDSPFPALATAFPIAEQIAGLNAEQIISLGILPARVRTILELANVIASGLLILTPGVEVAKTIEKLKAITGIGEWTAQYIAMRALAWPDAFPHTDLGVVKALGEKNPKRVLAAAEGWRPWRSYAVMHLWAQESSHAAVR